MTSPMHTKTDGVFLNKTLNFLGLGTALYGLAGLYQYLSHDPIIKHMVKCQYCRKRVNEKVSFTANLLTELCVPSSGFLNTLKCD